MTVKPFLWCAVAGLTVLLANPAWAARESKISATKHNLSSSGPGVTTSTTTQICVFCHTPHSANLAATGPLWNRAANTATDYTPYTSNSLDAEDIAGAALGAPGGSSKLCLSCHDGTVAVGQVSNPPGASTSDITVTSPSLSGGMISSSNTGFTRYIGKDLTNDHPISVTYTEALANRDGELRLVDATSQKYPTGTGAVIGIRAAGYKPKLPLEPTGPSGAGQIQCATCHDPHIRDTAEASIGNQKFLRLNRFQEAKPLGGEPGGDDIICLSCHDKAGVSWAYSAHANPDVAKQTYTSTTSREFPASLPVWKAACLNCHDTHTVPGARRLLREGTNSTATPKTGGSSAIEETCYQCHSTSSVVSNTPPVPNIKTDFSAGTRMPIAITTEKHDIGGPENQTGLSLGSATGGVDCSGTTNKCGADFIESRSKLADRHAECTDCHNPHRVIRYQNGLPGNLAGTGVNFNDTSSGKAKAGTHRHEDAAGYIHSNIISGVLRGSWGVEPQYSSPSFHDMPSSFAVKRGDPGTSSDTGVGNTYVTREYQICLKCHSNYGYDDDNAYPNSSKRPQLGAPGTAASPNGHSSFTSYTNQAKEFQAPATHAVATGSVSLGFNGGAGSSASVTQTNNNNHRSWHPVMAPTGRTGRPGSFLSPWNEGTGGTAGRLGVQTMYCSDCHGSSTGEFKTVMPNNNTATNEDGSPWGPHGSSENFLLKGKWNTSSGEGSNPEQESTLCFKCHSKSAYSGGGGTGFSTDKGDGHNVHSNRIDTDLRCNWCHVAVPHGWKNRSLLVNLNDIGPEVGVAAGTSAPSTPYTNGPYYRRAYLRVTSFPSGQWRDTNCNGGRDAMKSLCENAT